MLKKEYTNIKRLINSLLLIIIGIFLSFNNIKNPNALQEDWYSNYTYTIDDENNTITLTKYNGKEENVEIPSVASISEKKYNVIINGNVYSDNKTIKKIVFQNGVSAGNNLSNLFYNCSNLETIEFNNFNTEKVTTMENMFSFSKKLISLDLSEFDTSNVINMRRMFAECSALKWLDVSNFDTSSLENMEGMFYAVSKLEELDLSSFDTKKVTNMMDVFNGFLSIKKIVLGPKTDLKNTILPNASNFNRGTWKRVSDGKKFTTIKIGIESSSVTGAAGTYIKESDISSELDVDFPVTYKIEKISKISKLIASDDSGFYQQGNKIYATVPLTNNPLYEIPGSVDILFENVVSDGNNNKYNLKMTISNIKLFDLSTYGSLKEAKIEIVSVIGNGISFVHNFVNPNTNSVIYVNNNNVSRIQDVTMEIVDEEGNKMPGNFIFSAYDIDYPSYKDESGYGDYSEGFNLISGFDYDNLKLASLSFLQTSTTINDYKRITGTRPDNSSESSEFLIKANASGTKFQWTAGLTCTSNILTYYQPKMVEISKENSNKEVVTNIELELYKNDKLFAKWTTNEENKKIFLTPGKYTLKEVKFPDYYSKAEDIDFYVDINDTLTIAGENVEKIVMVNEYAPSAGVIEKHIDITTNEILEEKTYSGKINDEYHTTSKEFENYTLVEDPSNPNGLMKNEVIEVIYYYRQSRKVITQVNGSGGSVLGAEEVFYGEDSTPENIIIKPDKNFIIEKITINGEEVPITDETGMILSNFKEMLEDKVIEVTFIEKENENPNTSSSMNIIPTIIIFIICGIYLVKVKRNKILKI